MLFLRSNPKFDFSSQKKGALLEVNVKALDVYFNLTLKSMQVMNGKMPWRGGTEEDSKSMQMLIEVWTTHAYVILDVYGCTCWLVIYSKDAHIY